MFYRGSPLLNAKSADLEKMLRSIASDMGLLGFRMSLLGHARHKRVNHCYRTKYAPPISM